MKDTTKGPRYSVIPSRAVYDTTLTPRALRVLCALGVHSDNDGWCFPDQATIALELGLSRGRVSTAIVDLVKRGYIACEIRVQKGRGMRGLWYRVVLDQPGKPPPDVDTRDSTGVTKREHRVGAEQNGETDPVSPNGNTGAGVTKRRGAVSPNGNTGYIAERPKRTNTPIAPASGGRASCTTRGRAEKRERIPAAFAEAWALWPKPGSNKARALEAWRAHRATGAMKLAAVKAYLATKQAQAENHRYVPYLQRWLANSLASFVEVAQREAKRRADLLAREPASTAYEWDPETRRAVPRRAEPLER